MSRLNVTAIANGLVEDGVGPTARQDGAPFDLRAVAESWNGRARILDGLCKLERSHRKHIFVRVTEKRSVTRNVAVPLDLVRDLIGYIWDERQGLLAIRADQLGSEEQPDMVFLSSKTAHGFRPSSVSNLVNEAFRLAKVAGSAHRLRAAYAEVVVRDAYLRARSLHGRNFDPEAVRLLVRESLGHRKFKTVIPYLNRILAEENLLPGQPILVTREEYAASLRALVDAINAGSPLAIVALGQIMAGLDLRPRPEPSTIAEIRDVIARRSKITELSG